MEGLVRHWRDHRNPNSKCRRKTVLGVNLWIHRKNPDTGVSEYKCSHKDCKDSETYWHQKLNVHNHYNKVHGVESVQDFCVCSTCGEKFVSTSLLMAHENAAHIDRTCNCHICQKPMKDQYTLKKHLLTHKKDQLFQCEFCSKSFSVLRNMKQHQRVLHYMELGKEPPKRYKQAPRKKYSFRAGNEREIDLLKSDVSEDHVKMHTRHNPPNQPLIENLYQCITGNVTINAVKESRS